MKTDAQIGRVLVATLHQAIVEQLPARIDFYEHWLTGEGLRDGTIGLAPMSAVLGFLRTEGEPCETVMSAAGAYAADWTIDSMSALRLKLIGALPRAVRARVALRWARDGVHRTYARARVSASLRRGVGRLEIRDSLFCRVREPQATPRCAFYRALAARVFERFSVEASCRIEQCVATGGEACTIIIEMSR